MKRLFLLSLILSLLAGTLLHAQSALRFGGLYLGMKTEEMRALADSGAFMLMNEEKFNESTVMILVLRDSTEWSDPDLNKVGCRKPSGRSGISRCVEFSSAILFFHDNHLYSISVPSVSIHPSDIGLLNQHVDDALGLVRDAHGKPDTVHPLPLTKRGLARTREDFPTIAMWIGKAGKKSDKEVSATIYLSYGTAENGKGGEKVYNVWIKIDDEARQKRARQARLKMREKQN